MAKGNSTRSKARKPKFIEVEGHRLTEAMDAVYQRCLQSRCVTNKGSDATRILKMGLEDFLTSYRPSHKVKSQLAEIFQTSTRIGLAVGSMSEYPFYCADAASIRPAGCELLKKLALDLYNASAKLTAIAMNVEAENTTKLQDWLAADERVARIGRGVEVVRG